MTPVDSATYEALAALIHSEQSPVGIDAKKTHILILAALERLEQRLAEIERRLDGPSGN